MHWGNLDLSDYQEFECAPFVDPKIWEDKERKYATCYTSNQLQNIIHAYNQEHANDPIILKKDTKDQYLLWQALRSKLMSVCDSDVCWMSLPFVNSYLKPEQIEEMQTQFRPVMPMEKNGDTFEVWLSNIDIDNVMRQYEIKFTNFKFLGCFPCDWAKYISHYALDENSVRKCLDNGFDQIAVIFNTGTLKSGGQHWVCAFMDFKNEGKNYSIEYFDSVGNPCQKDIRKWLDNTERIINNICSKKKNKKDYCDKSIVRVSQGKRESHQTRGGECGVYCLYFIVRRLFGDTYKQINCFNKNDCLINNIPDITMTLLRIIFFRHPKNEFNNYNYDFDGLQKRYKQSVKNNKYLEFAGRGFR